MSFLAPLWLIALIPWTAAAAWLLKGRPSRRTVPFLFLWRGPLTGSPDARARRAPPLPLLFLAISGLFANLAASRCAIARPGRSGPLLTIIVDAGRSTPSREALAEAIEKLQPALLDAFGSGPVDLVPLPSGKVTRTDRSDWIAPALRSVSVLGTRAALQRAVADALDRTDAPVIVLTNGGVDSKSSRVIPVPISASLSNVGFVAIAAREVPRPQVMVDIRNDSKLARAWLKVSTAADSQNPIWREVDLPPAGETRKYFVDLPAGGDVIAAALYADDDLPSDNFAWLARQRTWPAIETRPGLPAEVRRMIDVYTRLRPPSESSGRVAVVDGVFNIPSNGPAIGVLTGPPKGPPPSSARRSLRVVEHPVTAYVDWSAATRDASAPSTPGEGWQPLVSVGDQVFVAIREQPARQIWFALQTPNWPKSADFVVFWTNALDWTGQGGDLYATETPDEVRPDWTKLQGAADAEIGVYRLPDGSIRASSLSATKPENVDAGDWRGRLAKRGSRIDTNPLELTLPCTIAAALLVIVAVRVGARSIEIIPPAKKDVTAKPLVVG